MLKLNNVQLLKINEYLKLNGDFLELIIKNENIYTFEFKKNNLLNYEYHPINLNKLLINEIKNITDNKAIFSNKSFWLSNLK